MRPATRCSRSFKPDNPFTKRYNPGAPEGKAVIGADWVSGSCFMARRDALEELGGFDEAYFMYLEDTDLCWRAHHAGWGVGFAGTAAVTHVQGVSTARHPYRMMVAHHRSALRFTVRTTTGWRRLAAAGRRARPRGAHGDGDGAHRSHEVGRCRRAGRGAAHVPHVSPVWRWDCCWGSCWPHVGVVAVARRPLHASMSSPR